jgi:heat shock protein HslJ
MGATLTLSAGQASGFGGCNQFTTSYVLDGQALSFEAPASTMMACEDPAMSFESVYLGALPSVASYAITGDTLELLDGTGTAALTYAAGPSVSSSPGVGIPAVLVGTWTVTQLNNGNQAVETVSGDPALTITFGADGSVVGFGGCNQFGGSLEVAGDSIAIGPLHATMMACGDPIDTTELQLTTALDASTVWSVRDGVLELRDDSGALQVGLSQGVAAPSPA